MGDSPPNGLSRKDRYLSKKSYNVSNWKPISRITSQRPCLPLGPEIPSISSPLVTPVKLTEGAVCLGTGKELLIPLTNVGQRDLDCRLVPVFSYVNDQSLAPQDIGFSFGGVFQIKARTTTNASVSFVAKVEGAVMICLDVEVMPFGSSSPADTTRCFCCHLSLEAERPKLSLSCPASYREGETVRIPFEASSRGFKTVFCRVINEGRSNVPLIVHLVTETKGSGHEFAFATEDALNRQYEQFLLPTVALCRLGGQEDLSPSELLFPITLRSTTANRNSHKDVNISGRLITSLSLPEEGCREVELGGLSLTARVEEILEEDIPEQPELEINLREVNFSGVDVRQTSSLRFVIRNCCKKNLLSCRISVPIESSFRFVDEDNHFSWELFWEADPLVQRELQVIFFPLELRIYSSTVSFFVANQKGTSKLFQVPVCGFGRQPDSLPLSVRPSFQSWKLWKGQQLGLVPVGQEQVRRTVGRGWNSKWVRQSNQAQGQRVQSNHQQTRMVPTVQKVTRSSRQVRLRVPPSNEQSKPTNSRKRAI